MKINLFAKNAVILMIFSSLLSGSLSIKPHYAYASNISNPDNSTTDNISLISNFYVSDSIANSLTYKMSEYLKAYSNKNMTMGKIRPTIQVFEYFPANVSDNNLYHYVLLNYQIYIEPANDVLHCGFLNADAIDPEAQTTEARAYWELSDSYRLIETGPENSEHNYSITYGLSSSLGSDSSYELTSYVENTAYYDSLETINNSSLSDGIFDIKYDFMTEDSYSLNATYQYGYLLFKVPSYSNFVSIQLSTSANFLVGTNTWFAYESQVGCEYDLDVEF